MACTFDFVQNGCFLEVVEQPSGKIIKQFNLATIRWENKGADSFQLYDGDDTNFGTDIDNVPAYATTALLFTFLDGLRDACAPPVGGGIPAPTTANGTVSRTIETGANSTAAGLESVTFLNQGGANALVDGAVLLPGESVSFTGYYNHFTAVQVMLPAISFDATGTSLAVSTFV